MAAAWSLVEEKRALRRAMRARREALLPAERANAARALGALVAGLAEVAAAGVVTAYLPTRGELDPAEAARAVTGRGGTVVYPRVTAERPRLRFHRIVDEAALVLGAFGIFEPPV